MKTHKENCISHVVKRISERFTKEDFITDTHKHGTVDFTKEVVNAIINAPNAGVFMSGGKGNRNIYKIKYHVKIKSVFVVWDKVLEVPVTVLNDKMYNKPKGAEQYCAYMGNNA